ncbi:MAG: rRNA maturation RNase YbeY [Gemmatimonadales bacterium]|jgi:probable rRNA maturation factor
MAQQTRDVRVHSQPGSSLPVPDTRDAVVVVLDGEGVGAANVSVTFLSGQSMRAMNRRTFGHDKATDVIAFGLPHPGRIVGDVYVCPSVARRTAHQIGVSEKEELLRLVVHGTLHVLGYDHPEGDERTLSVMWRVQERYVRQMIGGIE